LDSRRRRQQLDLVEDLGAEALDELGCVLELRADQREVAREELAAQTRLQGLEQLVEALDEHGDGLQQIQPVDQVGEVRRVDLDGVGGVGEDLREVRDGDVQDVVRDRVGIGAVDGGASERDRLGREEERQVHVDGGVEGNVDDARAQLGQQ